MLKEGIEKAWEGPRKPKMVRESLRRPEKTREGPERAREGPERAREGPERAREGPLGLLRVL